MYPIYEILITALPETERENLPLISVIVPLEALPFSKTVAPLLADERFLTCARGIVVNLAHVKDIQKDGFLMDNGEFVPISRRLYPSVKNTYIDFQFEHILS